MNDSAPSNTQRVVIVLPGLGNGGAERSAIQLAACWADAGRCVTIATLTSPETDFYALPSGIDRLALNLASSSPNVISGLFRSINRILHLRKELHALKPDVVVAFTVRTNVLVILASVLCSWRLIVADRSHPGLESLKGV
ncbi:MAG: hypothetical protein O3A63_09260 [Proteobacteria bacterium]|nr:hypothetical protein [Pseudomonadota bacterium]